MNENDLDVYALRERIAALEATVVASKEALAIARAEIDRRLEGMNEFRTQINQERSDYLTRDMYDREHGVLVNRVTAVEQNRTLNQDFNLLDSRVAKLEQSRAGYASVLAFIMAAAALLIPFLIRR